MRRLRPHLAALAASLAIGAAVAPGANAATEVGSDCVADELTMSEYVMVQEIAPPSNNLPFSVPSAGIVTGWAARAEAFGAEPVIEYLKVLRPVGPGQFRVIGESTSELAGPGQGPFGARIPVQVGDRIGVYGSEGVFYCGAGSSAGAGMFSLNRNLALGATGVFAASFNAQPAVSATVEADGDNDGYGDETQDRCPQSPAWHEIPCPSLTLDFFSLAAKKAVLVYVSAGVPAPVTVSAQVNRKLKLKPLQHLANPGQITKYKLPLTGALKRRLKRLDKGKTLGLKITASGANVAGEVRSETRTLRIKARG